MGRMAQPAPTPIATATSHTIAPALAPAPAPHAHAHAHAHSGQVGDDSVRGSSSRSLWPHPSHAYTPATSFFGSARGADVNRLHTDAAAATPHHHAPPTQPIGTVSVESVSAWQARPALAQPSWRPAAPSHTHESASASTPPRMPRSACGSPRAVGATLTVGVDSSPSRRAGLANALLNSHHPPHESDSRAAERQQHALQPNTHAHAHGEASQLGRAAAVSHSLSPFAPSDSRLLSSAPDFGVSGSASLARDSIIPSTDEFIEQLKMRVRQTNELLGTARRTQDNNYNATTM